MYFENFGFGNCSTKGKQSFFMMDNQTSFNQHGFGPIFGILKAQNYILLLNSLSLYSFFRPKSFLSKQVQKSPWLKCVFQQVFTLCAVKHAYIHSMCIYIYMPCIYNLHASELFCACMASPYGVGFCKRDLVHLWFPFPYTDTNLSSLWKTTS